MIRVKLSMTMAGWPLARQTPGGRGVWKHCQFFINSDIEECDYWVVYDDMLRPEKTLCCPQNTLLIMGEPPSVKSYNSKYYAQFATLLTVQPEVKHPDVIRSHLGLPWLIGGQYLKDVNGWNPVTRRDYDELKATQEVKKDKLLSVICSDKAFTPGHAQRLEFVRRLKQHFSCDLDVYGRNINDFEDKWDAIAPYKYHIALENSSCRDYWTEKLTDTFLADAYPLYYGCPNIEDYFSPSAFSSLDITDPDGSIRQIEAAILQGKYEQSKKAREEARGLILEKYNLFSLVESIISLRYRSCEKQSLHLRTETQILQTPSLRAKRVFGKIREKLQRKPNEIGKKPFPY